MRSFGLKLAGLGNRNAERPVSVRQRAEETAARLPPLLVAAERIAASVAQGVHGRRRVGKGESFWQFRRYQQGDPVQSIDWRQSAKREHLYIRENEWEAAQSVWVWLDRSTSMQYHSDDALPDKAGNSRRQSPSGCSSGPELIFKDHKLADVGLHCSQKGPVKRVDGCVVRGWGDKAWKCIPCQHQSSMPKVV